MDFSDPHLLTMTSQFTKKEADIRQDEIQMREVVLQRYLLALFVTLVAGYAFRRRAMSNPDRSPLNL